MWRIAAAALTLVLAGPRSASAQALQAYGFAGPTVLSTETDRCSQIGGGLNLLATSRFGASVELGEMQVANLRLTSVAIDGVYHWAHPRRRVEPFVAGGYSLFFTRYASLDSFNVGGGVHVWTASGIGLRLEFRDHVYPRFHNAQALSFRAGVAIRLTNRIW